MNVKPPVAIRVFTTNLNKITEDNKTIILREITKTLDTISDDYESIYLGLIDLLFSKSMNDDNFIHLYADVCFEIARYLYPKRKENGHFGYFYGSLINKYQAFFEDSEISHSPILQRNFSFSTLTELSNNSSVIPHTPVLKQKNRCTVFIALLICKKFIDGKTVKTLMKELIEKRKYEPVCILIENTYKSDHCKNMYKEGELRELLDNMYETRNSVSHRIRFKIEDTKELLDSL